MKEKFKKVLIFLKQPNLLFSLICYGLFAITAGLTIAFLCLNISSRTVLMLLYSVMGITFFYCAYLFVMFDFKKIKNAFKSLKTRLSQKSSFLNKLFNDTYFRTMLFTSISLLLGFGFVAYNAFAGIYYQSIWNGSISVYYMLLVLIKMLFLIGEYKLTKNKNITNEQKNLKRITMFKNEGWLLIFLNIVLIVPVVLLITSQKNVNLPMWVAIADATFSFYKMITCIYSFVKSRKNNNFSIKGIKNLNLVSACVTILSLTYTMIITFSEEVSAGIHTLMILSAVAVVCVNMWIALLTLKQGKKQLINTFCLIKKGENNESFNRNKKR